MRCHRNTWDYLAKEVPHHRAGTHSGNSTDVKDNVFVPPSEKDITAEPDGLVTVAFSGTTLAAVLHFCANIQDWPYRPNHAYNELEKAIGRRVGAAISEALLNVVPSASVAGPTAVIYLDDAITAKSTSA